MKNIIFKKDLYRYYGDKGESLKDRLLRPLELKYIYVYRKIQASSNFFSKIYYKLRLHQMSVKSKIQIPPSTKIGEGFYIGHLGPIIINQNAVLGKNINISPGVVIGQENRGARQGAPTIGNNCWIGANAVIVGNVKIGEDVLIAPLSFVNFDVPDHSVVIGNPAKITYRENATERYVVRTV